MKMLNCDLKSGGTVIEILVGIGAVAGIIVGTIAETVVGEEW